MTSKIYLEVLSDVDGNKVKVTVETYVTLFLFRYISCASKIAIYLIRSLPKDDLTEVTIDVSSIKTFALNWDDPHFQQEDAALFKFPVLVNDNCVIAGLCGVCRGLLKLSNDDNSKTLLGFKEGCLQAPSETSIWTKFCEIDFINCTKNVIKLNERNFESDKFQLPDEFGIFEKHLSLPVRMHNVYKVARNLANEKKVQSEVKLEEKFEECNIEKREKLPRLNKHRKLKTKINAIDSSVPIDQLNIPHTFAEGHEIHLVDIILYSCYFCILNTLPCTTSLSITLPLTLKWMKALITATPENFEKSSSILIPKQLNVATEVVYKRPLKDFHSLYKSDPKRYKPKNRIFTKQCDLDLALDKLNALNLDIISLPMITLKPIDWSSIPYQALPEGGQLPLKRLHRKQQQLECLAQSIIQISKPGDRIVDFCSGAGHLGILLAYLLPQCEIILLENKEESLMRAKKRVDMLLLENVLFFQCNLDYFIGTFNIGCSLHACGVATDIVLSHCINQKANFVCCPCCYGGIHSIPHIQYPRSQLYTVQGGLVEHEYIHIAHCADQAHDVNKGHCNIGKSEQGQFCMDVVDMDRKLMAEEKGYLVQLMRLVPEDCTPKNRLLVGVIDV